MWNNSEVIRFLFSYNMLSSFRQHTPADLVRETFLQQIPNKYNWKLSLTNFHLVLLTIISMYKAPWPLVTILSHIYKVIQEYNCYVSEELLSSIWGFDSFSIKVAERKWKLVGRSTFTLNAKLREGSTVIQVKSLDTVALKDLPSISASLVYKQTCTGGPVSQTSLILMCQFYSVSFL